MKDIGEQQEYDYFELSQTPFAPEKLDSPGGVQRVRWTDF
jgi:hypothetical protein